MFLFVSIFIKMAVAEGPVDADIDAMMQKPAIAEAFQEETLEFENFKAFFAANQEANDDPAFFSRFYNVCSDGGEVTKRSLAKIALIMGLSEHEESFSELLDLLYQKVKTESTAAATESLIADYDANDDQEIDICEFPAMLANFGVEVTLSNMFTVFMDLDTDESKKICKTEFTDFTWDYWTKKPEIRDPAELMRYALTDRVADIRELEMEKGESNITAEVVQSVLTHYNLTDPTKEVFDAILEQESMKSTSHFDKHIIDEHVYDFLAPFDPAMIAEFCALFQVTYDEDDEVEDMAEDVLDSLLDEIREVYLNVAGLLGVFSEGVELTPLNLKAACDFLQLGYSDQEVVSIFSRIDDNASGTIELCELGPRILQSCKTLRQKHVIILLQDVLRNLKAEVDGQVVG